MFNMELYLKRLGHVESFLRLQAPSVIIGSAYVLLWEMVVGTSYEVSVENLGMQLLKDIEGFAEAMSSALKHKRLERAGFCTTPIDGKECMSVKLPDDSCCALCRAKFDEDQAVQDAWERTPDGIVQMAIIQAQVDMDFPKWADPNRPSC